MSRITAVTHGPKEPGPNPPMTQEGKVAVSEAVNKALGELPTTRHIIIGTGNRFQEVATIVSACLAKTEAKVALETIKFSPLIGNADSGKQGETGFEVMLPDGTIVPVGNYIGVVNTPGIDLWTFLGSLPEGTILCTGREFIAALGVKEAKSAKVYAINPEDRTVTELT